MRTFLAHLHSLPLLMAFTFSMLLTASAGDALKPESGSTAEKKVAASWSFEPDPALPNVLILGDSISIGYGLDVRELLKGKANVYRPLFAESKKPENCSGTTLGVKEIDRWIGDRKWAVIHFNWGLHDLKRVTEPGGNKTTGNPKDPVQATVEQYAKNLEEIVKKLKANGARLVFATTTPVVKGCDNPYRDPEDPPRYNAAAVKIMEANGIRVDDLYAFAAPQLEKIQLPKNVHFTPAGSRALADVVAKVILEELEKAKDK
jgi:acyl-CoA thioesterase-1